MTLWMFVLPKAGCIRAKIGLTGQLDRRQPGNYFKPWSTFKRALRQAFSTFIFFNFFFVQLSNDKCEIRQWIGCSETIGDIVFTV